jgi:hypothetical protein
VKKMTPISSGESLDKDDFAWKLAESLLEDFRPSLETGFYDTCAAAVSGRNVGAFRELSAGDFETLTIDEFKKRRQLLDLFKKHTFTQDVYTPAEVLKSSEEKFFANQERLNALTIDWSDPFIREIKMLARGHNDAILGEYIHQDVLRRCTFGKKSSVGIPKRQACEGARWEAPITGSADQLTWFHQLYSRWHRPGYEYYRARAVSRQAPLDREVDCLEALLVNKTWKSKRMIMPNTTVGTLWSSGVGVLLEDNLRKAGYDIRALQPVHGELARFGSITGTLVTADQSLASDNITCDLISGLFSRKWASAFFFGRIASLRLGDRRIETKTFSTMGIGFTFPLQTLVFLSLLLAIRDKLGLGDSAVVSVYGDDLIYDERMHSTVVDVFPKFGLVINADKTFSTGYFRESCGQDYYRGVDVRPWHLAEPEDEISAGRRADEAFLYKAANGLARRWRIEEVPLTTELIRQTIGRVRGDDKFLCIPPFYTDTAGVKLTRAEFGSDPRALEPRVDVHGTHRFRVLAFEPYKRMEKRHAPYLWKALRVGSAPDEAAWFAIARIPIQRQDGGWLVKSQHGSLDSAGPQIFSWRKPTEEEIAAGKSEGPYRSKLTGKRVQPLIAEIPEQGLGRFRERPGVTSHWTPV